MDRRRRKASERGRVARELVEEGLDTRPVLGEELEKHAGETPALRCGGSLATMTMSTLKVKFPAGPPKEN